MEINSDLATHSGPAGLPADVLPQCVFSLTYIRLADVSLTSPFYHNLSTTQFRIALFVSSLWTSSRSLVQSEDLRHTDEAPLGDRPFNFLCVMN